MSLDTLASVARDNAESAERERARRDALAGTHPERPGNPYDTPTGRDTLDGPPGTNRRSP